MKSSQRTLLVWLFLVIATLLLFQNAQNHRKQTKISFKEFIQHVQKKEIETVTFKNHGRILGKFRADIKQGEKFETVGDTSSEYYVKLINEAGLVPDYDLEGGTSVWMQFLIGWGPMILIFVILMVFLRQVQSTGGKAMQFGRSKAKLLSEGRVKVTFKDVAGCEESKEELAEVVHFLRDPKKFTRLGGKIPKGILLMGPPGTGKTLLAKAVAGEAIVPFFTISGSDFVEMFVGVGASRVRDLFEQGKKHAPCIIFIDEIDAVGRQRGAGLGGGHDEREQTLNQLLVEMDGFDSQEGVILIAATNRPDVLDPALLRPGRFDRSVTVGKPDILGRTGILKVHARNKPLSEDVKLDVIAKGTPGFSGADLHNLVNEAALLAARANKTQITMREMEMAKDKVIMGPERRSMVISDDEKEKIAYHEAGHAVVGMSLKGLDPVHKVTIIPRGMALGVTQTLPSEDLLNMTKARAEKMISFLMGGTIAEEMIFGERTTGAGNDIERASDIARKMVCEWGFSDAIGPLTIAKPQGDIFLGREIQTKKGDISEKTSEIVDKEIRTIILKNYATAKKILEKKKKILKAMAEALLERETIHDEEIRLLMEGKALPAFSQEPPPSKLSNEREETPEEANEPASPVGTPDSEVA